jgi:hypothetical protein
MTVIHSTTAQGGVQTHTAHSAPHLRALVHPPAAASATREHSAHVGFSVLPAAHGVDSINCERGQRAGAGCGKACYTPSAWGFPPTWLPQILYNPGASSTYVCCTSVCAIECDLFEKHAFWH